MVLCPDFVLKLKEMGTRKAKSDPYIKSEIEKLTQNCPENWGFPPRFWLVSNGYTDPPSCPNGNDRIFKDGSVGFQFCGRVGTCACATSQQSSRISETKSKRSKDDILAENTKRRNTVLDRYGVEHISQDSMFRKTVESTCHDRYGAKTNLITQRKAIEATNISRFGHAVPTKSLEVKKKIIETKVRSHGDDWAYQERDKAKKTMMARYGVEHALQHVDFLSKRDSTTEARWGHANHMLNDKLIEKTRNTNTARYGGPHQKQIGYSAEDLAVLSDAELFRREFVELGLGGLLNKYSFSRAVIRNKLIEFGIPYDKNLTAPERIVEDIIKESGFNYRVRDRKLIGPQEVDFVIDDIKLAIEVCGLYWHSQLGGNKSRKYHADKRLRCLKAGYRLITVFDDELNAEAGENRLRHALGLSKSIGARKTVVTKIDSSEANEFLSRNHTQGKCRGSVYLGLKHDDVLVAVMAFGGLRAALGSKGRKGSWEILRYTGNVIGGASKLFSYFKKNYSPEEIISYCDLRWGEGDLYRKLGMEFVHYSPPNYWYLDPNHSNRMHRYRYRKSVLVNEGFDARKSEWDIMQERGFDRIWDCGNSKWQWNK